MIRWSRLSAVEAEERAKVAKFRATALWAPVASTPSTNVRIGASILMALGTFALMAVTALVGKPWIPSEIWLGFLVLWAGLDVGQFGVKRSTDAAYVAAKQGIMQGADKPPEAERNGP